MNGPVVPQFFLDINVRFPFRPVLAGGLSVRAIPRGLGIDFQGGPRRFILRGSKVTGVFDFLRTTLDGRHTLADILNAVPPDLDRSSVLDVLKLMHQRGVLVDADRTTLDAQMSGDSTSAFWRRKLGVTRSADSAAELVGRVTGSMVVVVASGLIGQLTVEFLARSGCASLHCLPLGDIDCFDAEMVRAGRELEDSPEGLETFLSTLRDQVRAADLLVVAMRGASKPLRDAINELVIENRTPLIFAEDDGEAGSVMFIEPRRSSCLRCREMREELTSDFALEDYLFAVELDETGRWLPNAVPAGELFPAAALIASQLAGEMVRYLTSASPLMFVNASLRVDLLSGLSRIHPVLRVPRCTACSPAALFGMIETRPE